MRTAEAIRIYHYLYYMVDLSLCQANYEEKNAIHCPLRTRKGVGKLPVQVRYRTICRKNALLNPMDNRGHNYSVIAVESILF